MSLTPAVLLAAFLLSAVQYASGDAQTAAFVLLAALLYVVGMVCRFFLSVPVATRPAGWAAARIPGYGAAVRNNQTTYEELIALGEALGDADSGLSAEQIDVFPTVVFPNSHEDGEGTDEEEVDVEEARSCAVCLEYFKRGDVLRILPCSEQFHKECIGTWLRQKPTCPLCRSRFA